MDVRQTNIENQMSQRTLEDSDVTFGEDTISELHDSLLSYILSFMSTKSAVRTSALSKRWKNVWKSVPKLDMNSGDFADEDEFMDLVDRLLAVHSGSCLKIFRLRYDLDDHDEYRFGQWFNTLIDCNIEHIDVINDVVQRLLVPGAICYCRTLVILELTYMSLDVPELVSLPRLKILNIHDVGFKDASTLEALISGCPVLEEAYITCYDWDNLDIFCVSSKSLKKLCIFNMEVDSSSDDKVLIEAPSLKYLCLVEQPFDFLTTNVADTLVEADLHVVTRSDVYSGDFRGNANNLPSTIFRARNLTLSKTTLEIFAAYQLRPAFAKLTYLDVEFEGIAWELLQDFLANSPSLQTLIVGGASNLPKSFKLPIMNKTQCLSLSLKFFELRGQVTGRPVETNLLKYFLRHSSILKKVTVHICDRFQMRKGLHLFLMELKTFERRFHHPCQVTAVQDKNRKMFPEYRDGKFSVWSHE